MNDPASFAPGTRVVHRPNPQFGFGVVKYVEEDAFGETRLQVSFDHIDPLVNARLDDLDIVGSPLEDAAAGRWGDVDVLRRKLAVGLVIGENNLTGCFTKAAVQPLPHQAYLVDRVVGGNRFGHLLADDVGLGKTIEAGLIITSLLRREPPQRVLIVCPIGLALQWQDELDDHFDLHFQIMGEGFDGSLANNWRTQPFVIAPSDRLKRAEYRELLVEIGAFDLVICDEAHRLTAARDALTGDLHKTGNYRLFEFLVESRLIRHVEAADSAPRSPRLLLLSGTPHQGDDERFLRLLHLVRPDLFQPDERAVAEQFTASALCETMTRTPKSRAVDWDGNKIFKGHDTTTLEVAWSADEAEVARLLTRYIVTSLEAAHGNDRSRQLVVALVMHTFHKIAASSWSALRHALERRRASLSARSDSLAELLALEDDDAAPTSVPAAGAARAFFIDELVLLDDLLQHLDALDRDSKWVKCADLLRQLNGERAGEKVLFFTQYRATQDYLCAQLAELFPDANIEVIHGDTPPIERREARLHFERSSRFLVSTEAGGEGVNLQKACHVMVNYDLPWNPMRLQQRIGRLDRYGQRHRVQVFNLRVPDSWDHRICARIEERLAVIQRTMSVAGLDEDYHEMLLGDVAGHIDPVRLFARASRGEDLPDTQVDSWIRDALRSAAWLRDLLSDDRGASRDLLRNRPTLTAEDFQAAFALACARHGLRLQDTRTSENQFLPGVFHFQIPDAFRDPVFRPSRTLHVVFSRDVFHEVRDQDLGRVRGQPIRPVLAGFGEVVTDWLFQTAMEARRGESAFCIRPSADWEHGAGWLSVWALRWLGAARRISTPDSIVGVFSAREGEMKLISSEELMRLARSCENAALRMNVSIEPRTIDDARRLALDVLRSCVQSRDTAARSSANATLLAVAAIDRDADATATRLLR